MQVFSEKETMPCDIFSFLEIQLFKKDNCSSLEKKYDLITESSLGLS